MACRCNKLDTAFTSTLLLLDLSPGIFEGNNPVEYWFFPGVVEIGAEIPLTQKLESIKGFGLGKDRFDQESFRTMRESGFK